MSNNYTITLSLGSGPKAEELARQIKAWAHPMPVSAAIRNLIIDELHFVSKAVVAEPIKNKA